MHAAISASTGDTICAPSAVKTLYPLSAGGLCDAVTTTPAAAPEPTMFQASMGVGTT
jgi:hypothetical protein